MRKETKNTIAMRFYAMVLQNWPIANERQNDNSRNNTSMGTIEQMVNEYSILDLRLIGSIYGLLRKPERFISKVKYFVTRRTGKDIQGSVYQLKTFEL